MLENVGERLKVELGTPGERAVSDIYLLALVYSRSGEPLSPL